MESKEKCARSPSRLCTEASTVEGLETGLVQSKRLHLSVPHSPGARKGR